MLVPVLPCTRRKTFTRPATINSRSSSVNRNVGKRQSDTIYLLFAIRARSLSLRHGQSPHDALRQVSQYNPTNRNPHQS